MLDLQSCRLSGTIPRKISRLVHFYFINIEHNTFEGELPTGFGNLTNFIFLLASDSGLSGRIPGELGSCKSLQVLDLSFNSLSGPLPDGLAELESILYIMRNSNELSGTILLWMSNWGQAVSISLAQNLFTGSLPPLDFKRVSLLDVSSNMLSGELSYQLCDTKPLRRLLLSDNKLVLLNKARPLPIPYHNHFQ